MRGRVDRESYRLGLERARTMLKNWHSFEQPSGNGKYSPGYIAAIEHLTWELGDLDAGRGKYKDFPFKEGTG